MNPRRFVAQTTLAILALAASVVALNYAVDPYGVTGAPRIAHFNLYKVDINDYSRLLKRYQPARGRYDTLIVGNSRVEMGLDPSHPCLSSAGGSAYNLGIPGASLRMQLLYALNAIYQQPVRRVFLGLDFTDFIYQRPPHDGSRPGLRAIHSSELRFLPSGERNPFYRSQWLKDHYSALFSLDALASSIKTILLQDESAPNRDLRGFNPARDFASIVRIEGPAALFQQKMAELTATYDDAWTMRNSSGELVAEFDDLRSFLTIAMEQDIEVVLFTNPFHDAFWDLLRQRGLLPLQDEWLAIVAVIADEHGGSVSAFWDFSGDSRYIHERVPEPGESSDPLRWFWEPAHYRSQLGDLMLRTMLSESCGTVQEFGRRLG